MAVADTSPAVKKLPAVALPVALTNPAVRTLPPIMLPVEVTSPVVRKLPASMLPVTLKFPSVPTEVKLEYSTFELNVLPTKALAFTLEAVTPVNWLPLPMK